MRDQFIPPEYFKIIANQDREKEFYSGTGILYQEAEEFLWENHGIIIEVMDVSTDSGEEPPIIEFECSIKIGGEYLSVILKGSPIAARREGILKATEYIHSQKK